MGTSEIQPPWGLVTVANRVPVNFRYRGPYLRTEIPRPGLGSAVRSERDAGDILRLLVVIGHGVADITELQNHDHAGKGGRLMAAHKKATGTKTNNRKQGGRPSRARSWAS